MADTEKKKLSQDKMIQQVMLSLQNMGEQLRNDRSKSMDEMLPQADVLLHTMHFLADYEENVKVLNKYWLNKRQKEKYNIIDTEELDI